jgi:TPP-dependent trihydroxycyclohexane-1,2-dione (THcHDO) dehydratase
VLELTTLISAVRASKDGGVVAGGGIAFSAASPDLDIT